MIVLPDNGTASDSVFGIEVATGRDTCSLNTYGSRSLITFLPACIRMWQCIRQCIGSETKHRNRHLLNCGKYSATAYVVLFGAFYGWYVTRKPYDARIERILFALWILAYLVSTLYSYVWDVFVDWSLGEIKNVENRFLRNELFYAKKWYYVSRWEIELVIFFICSNT